MLKRLLLVADVLLIVAIGALGARLYTVWSGPGVAVPAPQPASVAPETPPEPAPAEKLPAHPPLSTFTVVAERNLFSPTRNEEAPGAAKPATPAGPPVPKPRLYGVVLEAATGARAYLEDPKTRKTFAYGVGDSVAGSVVKEIKDDRVVLQRGGEVFEVLLRDPTKPKPPPPPPTPVPVVAPPGVPPGAASPQIQVPGAPVQPGVPVQPRVPTRRGVPGYPGVVSP